MLKNQRTAYGQTLTALGDTDARICVLDADLSKSTMGCLFKEKHPERHFEMGIAEQNMLSTAAGLSLTGKIPFASTFAVFATGRAYDQFRQTIAIAGLNVKLCGSSAGLSDFGDGSTHQAIEDMALMRAIPGMTVLSPADADQCVAVVKYMAANPGPMYIRVNRNDVPAVTGGEFDPARPQVLREGNDVTLFATGIMVSRALEAADALAAEGVQARVVNVAVIKPLNEDAVAELARGAKAVVTAEEHSVVGGLGDAVAHALRREGVRMDMVGVRDCFGTSALDYQQLLEEYGLTAQAIVKAVKGLL